MSLVRARRRRTAARRPRARQGQGHQGRTLGDYHFEASPSTSVTRNSEATRHALSCHRGITMVTEGRIVVA